MAPSVQFPIVPACLGQRSEFHLTTLFSDTAITTLAPIDAPTKPKRRSWLPVLTVLFVISYALMTMLIMEQGSTIESQRVLIRELFRDSSELSASKMKAQREKNGIRSQNPSARTQPPVTQAPSAQTPSTQDPSTQAQASQAPSSQAAPQHRAQNRLEKTKPEFQMPSRPAADLVDARRALITI